MEGTIWYHEMLAEMEKAKPFKVLFIKSDAKRGTSGQIKETIVMKLNKTDDYSIYKKAKGGNNVRSKSKEILNHSIIVVDQVTDLKMQINTRLIKKFNDKWVKW